MEIYNYVPVSRFFDLKEMELKDPFKNNLMTNRNCGSINLTLNYVYDLSQDSF